MNRSLKYLTNFRKLFLNFFSDVTLETLSMDMRRAILSNMDIFTAAKLAMTNKFWKANATLCEADLRKQSLKYEK